MKMEKFPSKELFKKSSNHREHPVSVLLVNRYCLTFVDLKKKYFRWLNVVNLLEMLNILLKKDFSEAN